MVVTPQHYSLASVSLISHAVRPRNFRERSRLSIATHRIKDRESSFGYRYLLSPALRSLLDFDDILPQAYCLGACVDGEPCGLAVAVLSFRKKVAYIRSLYVRKDYRRSGVSHALMARLLEDTQALGVQRWHVSYREDLAYAAALEVLFQGHGFDGPRASSFFMRFKVAELSAHPLLRARPLRSGSRVLKWHQLPAPIYADLKSGSSRYDWIPRSLNPLNHEEGCAADMSFALLHDDELISWCLTHLEEKSLRVTVSYARFDTLQTPALQLWRYLAVAATKADIESVQFALSAKREKRLATLRRRFGPYAQDQAFFLELTKQRA